MKSTVFIIVTWLTLFSASVFAQDARDEQVRFEPGSSGTTIKETITGYESVNYKLRAKAGQSMSVILDTSNGSNYFNIFEPGKAPGDEAMFIGSMHDGRYDGILPASGEYTLQVFLMRNAARRNENAQYTLTIRIDG